MTEKDYYKPEFQEMLTQIPPEDREEIKKTVS